MNDIQKRFIAFLIGCMGARLLLTYLSYKLDSKYLPYMGILTLIIGLGFTSIYIFGLRKIGAETFGREIWWNNLRPIHAFFYLYFTYLAFKKKKISYLPLLIDTILGLIAFLYHHYSINSFEKLFT